MSINTGPLDEGTVIFKKISEDEIGIFGVALTPGSQAAVTTKNGDVVTVLVGEIIDEQQGIRTATFEWIEEDPTETLEPGQAIYRKDNHLGQYIIVGRDLTEGATATVITKNGGTHEVTVGEIQADDGTVQSALYRRNYPPIPDGQAIYRHGTDTDEYFIEGPNLEEGKDVKVTTKTGKTHTVTVDDVITVTEEGTVLATYIKHQPTDAELTKGGRCIFREIDGSWFVIGQNLAIGQSVRVSTRKGTQTVKITAITKEEDGIQLARYTWPKKKKK